MNKKISFLIIVPTLNSFQKLGNLVKSLKFQSYNDWKVIFIDGPSSKKHKEWIMACSKRDNRFLVKEEKANIKGIFPSMSYGVELAKEND